MITWKLYCKKKWCAFVFFELEVRVGRILIQCIARFINRTYIKQRPSLNLYIQYKVISNQALKRRQLAFGRKEYFIGKPKLFNGSKCLWKGINQDETEISRAHLNNWIIGTYIIPCKYLQPYSFMVKHPGRINFVIIFDQKCRQNSFYLIHSLRL